MTTNKGQRANKGLIKALLVSTALTAGFSVAPVMQQAYAQTAPARSFAIAPQALATAITAFAQQSGLQLSVDPALVQGLSSAGLKGTHGLEAGLSLLLNGTGLTFSFLDQTTVIISGQNSANTSAATDGTIMLGQVDVNARAGNSGAGWNGSAETVYMTPGSVSYISNETISRFPGTGAGDIFKSSPGVIAAANRNGSSMDVNIRGLQGQNRVKVAIDGTQQSTSTWRGYLGVDERVYLDPDLIGGVSIEKGPSGGAAGAGVIGGVVSVRTLGVADVLKDGQSFGGRIRLGVSDKAIEAAPVNTFDQRTTPTSLFDFANGSASGALAATSDNFDFVVATAVRKTGNYFAGSKGTNTYTLPNGAQRPLSYTKPGEEVFNSAEETFSALAKGTIRWGDEHSLELGYVHFESKFGESLGSLLTMQDSTLRQVSPATANTNTYTARYHWAPNDDLIDFRANAWLTTVDAVTRSVGPAFYFPPFLTPENKPPADDPRVSNTVTWGVDVSNTSRFDVGTFGITLDVGASYSKETLDAEAYLSRSYASDIGVYMDPSNGTREIASLFGRGKVDVTDWLQLNAGLRYDAYRVIENGDGITLGNYNAVFPNREGGRLNPTFGVTLMPLEGVQLYGIYSEGSRPPSMRETLGGDALLEPNPYLRAEVARNWEFGLNYSTVGLFVPQDTFGLKLSYFDNTYDDYISRISNPTPGPGRPFYAVGNIHQARYTGVELAASYDAGGFFGDLAVTKYTGFEFCRTADSCISESISNDYAVNQLTPEIYASLTLGTRLFEDRLTLGTRIIAVGDRLGPEPVAFQQTNLWKHYTTVDAFASFEVNDNLNLGLNIQNVMDTYYVDALDGWMPSPGRTITATLTGKF